MSPLTKKALSPGKLGGLSQSRRKNLRLKSKQVSVMSSASRKKTSDMKVSSAIKNLNTKTM